MYRVDNCESEPEDADAVKARDVEHRLLSALENGGPKNIGLNSFVSRKTAGAALSALRVIDLTTIAEETTSRTGFLA